MTRLRVALCQLNQVVGDLDGNVSRILDALEQAEGADADVALFPELAITGYPPEDLLLKPGFVTDNQAALVRLAERTGRCAAVVGFVDAGRDLHNAAAVCAQGRVLGTYRKRLLPNYAVFDEQRYFAAGNEPLQLYEIGGVRVGLSICEDVWSPEGPMADHAAGGAEVVLNLNASPWSRGRVDVRERMLATRAADASCVLVYVNQVGGQDELVFDGASSVFDSDGTLLARLPQFVETVDVVDIDVRPVFRKRLLDPRGRASAPSLAVGATVDGTARTGERVKAPMADVLPPVAEVYDGLVLGTRDYVDKSGITDVVIALSGGIDSTLVACIAADALGPDRVHGVSMPSRYSSEGSKDDAAKLAANLGIHYQVIPIEPAHDAFERMLPLTGIAAENLQSRIRGVIQMGLSNEGGSWIVLTTGNKTELAVGYATLYGDTAGGFAVIKDVPKLLVYDLCRYVNERAGTDIVPVDVLTKPPSAELRPDQRDDQSLPPYELLDPLLEAYIEEDMTQSDLIAAGYDAELVKRVVSLVDRSEYKRRQTPPGVRISSKAFGKDRRVPIVNRYRG